MFYYFLLAALFLIALLINISLIHFLITGNSPTIGTPVSSFKEFGKTLSLNKETIFYDLGCGDSRLIRYLSKAFPSSKFVGIENSLPAYIWSKLAVFIGRNRNVEIVFKNFFNVDLSSATHIYLWIFERDLDILKQKFDRELQKGCLVYSLDFPIKGIKAKDVVEIGSTGKFGHRIYIYQF